MYVVEHDNIYFVDENKRIPLEGDAASFSVLRDATIPDEEIAEIDRYKRPSYRVNQCIAKDARTVWHGSKPIPDADAASFTYFYGGQCKWGHDKNRIYCFYNEGWRIKSIGSKTSKNLGFFAFDAALTWGYRRQYAHDGKLVYYYGRKVLSANAGDFKPIRLYAYDAATDNVTEDLSSGYYQSGDQIYHAGKDISKHNPMLSDASPATTIEICVGGGTQPFYHILRTPQGFFYQRQKLEIDSPIYAMIPDILRT